MSDFPNHADNAEPAGSSAGAGPPPPLEPNTLAVVGDRRRFFALAALCYSTVAVLCAAANWGLDLQLQRQLTWRADAALWGVLAIGPMLAAYLLARGLQELVIDVLGQTLSHCRIWELILLAAAAGVGEELLFRGVLEVWIGRWSPVAACVTANLLFGACHALNLTYFALATAFGFYFSGLAALVTPRSLLAPILAHALYDFVAFLLIARSYRGRRTSAGPRAAS